MKELFLKIALKNIINFLKQLASYIDDIINTFDHQVYTNKKTMSYFKTLIPDYLFTINIHIYIYIYIYIYKE